MKQFDVFNGDADGICALHQLRLATPVDGILVTGLKRDIRLLERVDAQAGDHVTVLDVSLDANRVALLTLLARGVQVKYSDHHHAASIPHDDRLDAHLDTSSDVCTSMLVDRYLCGRYRPWAVVGAYGDNLVGPARRVAQRCGVDSAQESQLRELGVSVNYNAYGDSEADLTVAPATLYEAIKPYTSPVEFIAATTWLRTLSEKRREDMVLAWQRPAAARLSGGSIYVLPDAAWSRRVRGVFANALANAAPSRAHAVFTPRHAGGYVISVRAPLTAPHGADLLCRAFGGDGREAAAGVDGLTHDRFDDFTRAFAHQFAPP
jgi:single-stranded DNA-specific DHH superfamily exonuclease